MIVVIRLQPHAARIDDQPPVGQGYLARHMRVAAQYQGRLRLTGALGHLVQRGSRAATLDEVAQRAGKAQAALILCGHTHMPRKVALPDGRLIVNPGSVGLQAYDDDHLYPHVMENGTPHARYAILERSAQGDWSAHFHAVEYDWEAAAQLALANGRPDWAVPLRTGRVGLDRGV